MASRSTAAWRSSTSKATLRSPSSLAIAAGDPGWWSGRTKLESSSRVPPSGGRSMTISVRASGMPMTVSRNSPSMNARVPSTSRPSPTKNVVTVSRSATVMPTWSKRRANDMGPSFTCGVDSPSGPAVNASLAGTSTTDLVEAPDLGRPAAAGCGQRWACVSVLRLPRAGVELSGRGTAEVGDPPLLIRPGGEGERVDRDRVQPVCCEGLDFVASQWPGRQLPGCAADGSSLLDREEGAARSDEAADVDDSVVAGRVG